MTARQALRQRQAPAFQLEVRAPFLWRLLTVLLWALAWCASAAAVLAQVAARLGPEASTAGLLLALPLLPLVCCLAWRHRAGEVWQLLWDGQQWALRPGAARQAAQEDSPFQAQWLQVSMDLGGFLLLRCRPTGEGRHAAVYLPLTRRQHPGLWLRLRWALFSARGLPPQRA